MSNRFYPEAMPEFPYEPNRERFDIVRVGDSVGEGVIALVDFNPGEVVFGFTGFYSEAITLFSLQYRDGLHLHDPFFMGKVLHCCDPNAICDMDRRLFIARKPIKAGEFITMDYASTEDYLYRTFNCECGADQCRGYVTGRKQVQFQEAV